MREQRLHRPPSPSRRVAQLAPAVPRSAPDASRPLALVQECDDVVVLRAAGDWTEVTTRLTAEAAAAFAEAPRAVVVDLSTARGAVDEAGLDGLMDLGRHARDWPGTAFAVTCPDSRIRALLRRHPMGLVVHVTARTDRAILAVADGPRVQRAAVSLAPQTRAARAARDLVSRTCLDWRLAATIPPACLLVSELVNNAVQHAGTGLEVTLARADRWVRIAVRDGSSSPPRPRERSDGRVSGRGLLLVDRIADAWGQLPTGDGGKVVWTVLAVPSA